MTQILSNSTKLGLTVDTVLKTSFGTWYTARKACKDSANQKWSELSRLVHLLRRRPLHRVLEIGVSSGGTLALWARLAAKDAHLVGVDMKIEPFVRQRLNSECMGTQTVQLMEGSSHSHIVKNEVSQSFGGQPLDFLFIDGDHSYEGVKCDWEMYSPLVRPRGVVAFHDIVPDHRTQFGVETKADAGQVHKLWNELKEQFEHYEFVENAAQDGYGIGVLVL